MNTKVIEPVLKVVLPYLLFGGIYILFSDQFVQAISQNQNMITKLQTYKGWGFVFVSSIGLFLVLYKLLRDLNKEKEIQFEAQSLLQKSEQMFRLLFHNSGEAILMTKPDGSIDAANPEACNIFGRSEEEICSIGRDGIVDLKDPKLLPALEERNKTGKFIGELDFIRKDGTKFPCEVNSAVYIDPQGLIRTSMIIRDISERKRIENGLISKNEFIQTVLDNLPLGIALNYMDKGTAFYHNKKFEEIYGWPAEELADITNFFTKVYPDEEYRNSLVNRILTDIKSGDINRMHWDNCKVTHKDGSTHFVNAVNIPLFQQNIMVSTVWDITERKLTEEKIFESEVRYRRLHETMFDCYVQTTMSGKIIDVNHSYIEMLGYTKEELLSLTYNQITPQHWFEFEHKIIEDQILIQGYSDIYEKEYIKKDGTVFPVELRTYLLRDADGNPESMWAIVRDITNRKKAEQALQKSEERYRLISSVASDYVFSSDVIEDGSLKLNWVSGSFEKITGYTFEEYTEQSGWFKSLHPDDIAIDKLDMENLHNNKKVITELRTIAKNGNTVWVRVYAQPVWDNQKNKLIGIYGAVQDITERKLAEDDLKSKNNLLTAIYESSPFIMLLVDKAGKVISINKAGIKFSSREKNDIIGLLGGEVFNCLNSFIAPGCGRNEECSTCPIRTRVNHTFATGELILNGEGEMTFLMNDQEISLTLSISTILINRPEGDAVLVFIEDITERKTTELALLKSRKEFQSYFDSSSIGLSVTDPDKTWIEVNQRLCDMLGYARNELAGHTWIEFSHPDDVDKNNKLFHAALNGEIDKFELDKRFIRKDGSIIFVILSAVCTRNDDGTVHHFLSSYNDITHRKLAEDALKESENFAKTVVDALSSNLAILDKTGVILEENYAWRKFAIDNTQFGSNLDLGAGANYLAVCDNAKGPFSEGAKEAAEGIRSVISGELTEFSLTYPCNSPDEERWFILRVTRFPGQGAARVVVAHENITERKLAELKLMENEEIFNQLMEHSPIHIFFKDENIRPLRLSRNYEQMLNMPVQKLLGKNMYELFPSELANNMVEDDKKILLKGELVKVDEEFNGRYYNTIKFPINIEGKPRYLAGFTLDITESKLAEDALRESEQRFHSMFENHNAVMILIEPESGQILDANQSAAKYYGYSIKKLKQLNISEINVMSEEELAIKLRNSTLVSRSHTNFPHKLSSGEIRLVEEYTSPISVNRKTVLFSIIHDITERKKAEQELFESQDKLRALTGRLERVQEEERINLSRELHDHLGQNLTGLKMDTAWLAKKIQSDAPVEPEVLIEKTTGMQILIDELINNVRKISAELRPNVLDYLGLIPAIEWQLEELKKRTEIACVFKSNVQKIDLGVQINSSIFRILQEAFTNIIRHSGATKVEVMITEESEFIKLEILDNGIGINENNISNVRSLGILGMTERTLQFNGRLHLEKAPQGGTLLTLIIPKQSEI
jgi:PAS domain S-box-containing protein